MIIGVVYAIVPMELLVEKIWDSTHEPEKFTWDQAIRGF